MPVSSNPPTTKHQPPPPPGGVGGGGGGCGWGVGGGGGGRVRGGGGAARPGGGGGGGWGGGGGGWGGGSEQKHMYAGRFFRNAVEEIETEGQCSRHGEKGTLRPDSRTYRSADGSVAAAIAAEASCAWKSTATEWTNPTPTKGGEVVGRGAEKSGRVGGGGGGGGGVGGAGGGGRVGWVFGCLAGNNQGPDKGAQLPFDQGRRSGGEQLGRGVVARFSFLSATQPGGGGRGIDTRHGELCGGPM